MRGVMPFEKTIMDMKTLKFFAVLMAAFAMLVACEPVPSQGQKPGGENDTIPSDTLENPQDTIVEEEPLVIKLDWTGLSDSESANKTYEVGMANFHLGQFSVFILLTNKTSEDKTFTLKEVRHYDLTTAFAGFCTDNCYTGNGEAEQIWNLATVKAGETYLENKGGFDVTLMPMVSEKTTFKADFTLSDGTTEKSFTINYNYTPEAE